MCVWEGKKDVANIYTVEFFLFGSITGLIFVSQDYYETITIWLYSGSSAFHLHSSLLKKKKFINSRYFLNISGMKESKRK